MSIPSELSIFWRCAVCISPKTHVLGSFWRRHRMCTHHRPRNRSSLKHLLEASLYLWRDESTGRRMDQCVSKQIQFTRVRRPNLQLKCFRSSSEFLNTLASVKDQRCAFQCAAVDSWLGWYQRLHHRGTDRRSHSSAVHQKGCWGIQHWHWRRRETA